MCLCDEVVPGIMGLVSANLILVDPSYHSYLCNEFGALMKRAHLESRLNLCHGG